MARSLARSSSISTDSVSTLSVSTRSVAALGAEFDGFDASSAVRAARSASFVASSVPSLAALCFSAFTRAFASVSAAVRSSMVFFEESAAASADAEETSNARSFSESSPNRRSLSDASIRAASSAVDISAMCACVGPDAVPAVSLAVSLRRSGVAEREAPALALCELRGVRCGVDAAEVTPDVFPDLFPDRAGDAGLATLARISSFSIVSFNVCKVASRERRSSHSVLYRSIRL